MDIFLLFAITFKILSTTKWINCGWSHLKIIEFRGFPQHQTSGENYVPQTEKYSSVPIYISSHKIVHNVENVTCDKCHEV